MSDFGEIKYASKFVQNACDKLRKRIEDYESSEVSMFVVVMYRQDVSETTQYLAKILINACRRACVHVKLQISHAIPEQDPMWINQQGAVSIGDELVDI